MLDIAKQLQQGLFNPDSETYKVLELGWNSELDRPLPPRPIEPKKPDKPRPTIEKPVVARMNFELAFNVIACIQFTLKNAVFEDEEHRKQINLAVAFAKDLQQQFNPNSEVYELLADGWEKAGEETATADAKMFEEAVEKACREMGIQFVKLE